MKYSNLGKLLLGAFLLILPVVPEARGEDGQAIVDKASLAYYYGGDDGRADVKLTIKDKAGRERVRELILLRMDIEDGGDQRFYLYFKHPFDVEGMVFMVWKHADSTGKETADDERWLYVPASDLVQMVSVMDKRSSFAGSHVVYEDVSGRGTRLDNHKLTGEDERYYYIKSTPKDPSTVEFSYYTVKIDKETYLPMSGEYYNKKGEAFKRVKVEEVKTIDGVPTIVKGRVTDLRGGETLMEFSGVEYNIGLKEGIFKERYLRKPLRKWLK